jgi:signal transduction histidine kinase
MNLVSRFNNDKMLIIGLLVHLMIGWMWRKSADGEIYLVIVTFSLLLNLLIFTIHRPFWRATVPYHRYILLLSLVCCTIYIQVSFSGTLIPILHMISVIVVSAFYLMPRLIWFISSCYILSYILYLNNYEAYKTDIYSLVLAIIFILFIVIALHKICLICHLQMTQIRKLEREQNFERLGQQQHLATIGQIAASIAHDIRNPLTSIQGFVQLI